MSIAKLLLSKTDGPHRVREEVANLTSVPRSVMREKSSNLKVYVEVRKGWHQMLWKVSFYCKFVNVNCSEVLKNCHIRYAMYTVLKWYYEF